MARKLSGSLCRASVFATWKQWQSVTLLFSTRDFSESLSRYSLQSTFFLLLQFWPPVREQRGPCVPATPVQFKHYELGAHSHSVLSGRWQWQHQLETPRPIRLWCTLIRCVHFTLIETSKYVVNNSQSLLCVCVCTPFITQKAYGAIAYLSCPLRTFAFIWKRFISLMTAPTICKYMQLFDKRLGHIPK